jgi:toxin ParE1/3/4
VRLRYTPRALVELDEVLAYIAARSPGGARRVQGRIQTAVSLLLRYPHSGQRTSLRSMRRIAATPYPYWVYYELTDDEVIILGVRHTARDPAMPDTNA